MLCINNQLHIQLDVEFKIKYMAGEGASFLFQPEPDSIKCDLESTLARMVAANSMGIQTKELNTSKARSW